MHIKRPLVMRAGNLLMEASFPKSSSAVVAWVRKPFILQVSCTSITFFSKGELSGEHWVNKINAITL